MVRTSHNEHLGRPSQCEWQLTNIYNVLINFKSTSSCVLGLSNWYSSEISVEGDGEPLGEGLLGAVLESRGYGPLDRRHQREASAWLHGHCLHKQSKSSLTILTS